MVVLLSMIKDINNLTTFQLVEKLGLLMVNDLEIINNYAEYIIMANGIEKPLGYLVGKMMEISRGTVDPTMAKEAVIKAIENNGKLAK